MDTEINKLNSQQRFLILFYIASLLASFAFGYTVFKYLQIEDCKSPMRIIDVQHNIYK